MSIVQAEHCSILDLTGHVYTLTAMGQVHGEAGGYDLYKHRFNVDLHAVLNAMAAVPIFVRKQ